MKLGVVNIERGVMKVLLLFIVLLALGRNTRWAARGDRRVRGHVRVPGLQRLGYHGHLHG